MTHVLRPALPRPALADRDASTLRARVEALAPWVHNLHPGNGVWTAPGHVLGDDPRLKLWQLIRRGTPAHD